MTIEVNTVPNANWHDAMFTQFAARADRLRHPDPGLPAHRRGRDERQHPRPHRLRRREHRRRRLRPVPPGGLRPVPPGRDRAARRGRQPLRPAAARRHLDDDLPQGPDRRGAARDLGRDDLRRPAVPGRTTPASAGWPSTSPTAPTPRPSPTTRSTASTAATSGTLPRGRSRASSTTRPARRRWTSWSTR